MNTAEHNRAGENYEGGDVVQKRLRAARQLTKHLEQNEQLSFIRLGDGEVHWLLAVQDDKPPPKYSYDATSRNVESVRSTSGLEARHYARFVRALEGAGYLDYCDSISYVQSNLPRLRIERPVHCLRNVSPETSNILFEWTRYELNGYLKKHRCLFGGAEAHLLQALCSDQRYRQLASDFIPTNAELEFHQLRNDGRQYSENIDLIKSDLIRDIREKRIDTLLLSMGTGAKILCFEIAEELRIRTIDFGSMMRALTYSGAPGYQAIRSLHNPYLFRVPMEIYMPALERSAPDMDFVSLIARAHAQAVLDIQDLKPLRFNTADGAEGGRTDLSPASIRRFNESITYYNRKYRTKALLHKEAIKYHLAFIYWRMKKGLGPSGILFQCLVWTKRQLRRLHALIQA